MVRQARIYFTGAVSGTALIGLAVVAFVVLVSLQAVKDWPLAALGEGGDGGSVSISPARPSGGEAAPRSERLRAAGAPAAGAGGRNASRGAGQGGSTASTEGGRALTGSPRSAPGSNGGESTQTTAGSQPSGSAGRSPSGGGAAASGAGGGPTGGPNGGGPPTGGESGGAPKLSETVTGTVDTTVTGVDEAAGGVLGETGVPKASEEVVEGVAGPESVVGGTLDHTVEAVGGLLDGGR